MKNILVKAKRNALFNIDFAGLYTVNEHSQFFFALLYFSNQLFSTQNNQLSSFKNFLSKLLSDRKE